MNIFSKLPIFRVLLITAILVIDAVLIYFIILKSRNSIAISQTFLTSTTGRWTGIQSSTDSTDTPSNSTDFNVNLLTNGDAETGSCETSSGVIHPEGWNYDGLITQVFYSNIDFGPLSSTSIGPRRRGQCYFFGNSSPITSMWQIIYLNDGFVSFLVHGQSVYFKVSAWIGGWDNQDDNARVNLLFLDSNQVSMNMITLGPVLARDRSNQSSLIYRERSGLVPLDTRSLKVEIIITRVHSILNDGCIDNISLILY